MLSVHPRARVVWSTTVIASTILAGCGDMPIATPDAGRRDPPRILAGPYLDGAQPRPTLRLLLDQPATVAVRRDETIRRVERDASFSAAPAVRVDGLSSDRRENVRLLVANHEGPGLSLRGAPLPETTAPVHILFAPQPHPALAELARRHDVDALVLLPPAPGAPALDSAAAVLEPLGSAAWRAPLHFVNGAGLALPADLFPDAGSPLWARRVGGVAIFGLDLDGLADPATRDAAIARVREGIARPPPGAVWRVAALSRAPYAGRLDTDVLLGLEDDLEAAGITLAVAPAAGGYWRTYPFYGGRGGFTRQIAFGGGMAADQSGGEPDFVERRLDGDAVAGLLTAMDGQLRWRALTADGSVIDEAVFGADSGAAAFAKRDLLAEAATLATVRAESLRAARQAARAAAEPGRPLRLPIAMENPAARPTAFRLAWRGVDAADRRWNVTPAVVDLTIQPGRGALAWFEVSPGPGSRDVVLEVGAGDAGVARETLLVFQQRRIEASFVDRVVVDGRLTEEAWRGFPDNAAVFDFAGEAADRRTRVRSAADALGLLLAFDCQVKGNPRSLPTRAADPLQHRDSPAVLLEDGVEAWVDPAGRGRDWFRFAVNAAGVRYDESSRTGRDYKATWEAAVNRREGGRYRVEMRIPWRAFDLAGPPEPGAEWGINFTRRDAEEIRDALRQGKDGVEPRRLEWADTRGVPGRSGLYGRLRFEGPPPPAPASAPNDDGDGGPPAATTGNPFRFLH